MYLSTEVKQKIFADYGQSQVDTDFNDFLYFCKNLKFNHYEKIFPFKHYYAYVSSLVDDSMQKRQASA